MNQKLLNEHIEAFIASVPVIDLKEDGSNAVDFFCADIVGNCRFAQNFGGYPRSEIADINDCVNLEMQKNLLSQLIDYRHQADGQNAGKTDVQIAMGHRSKYCQMPSEMQDWIEVQLQNSADVRIAQLKAVQARQAKYQNKKFDKDDVNKDDVNKDNVNE